VIVDHENFRESELRGATSTFTALSLACSYGRISESTRAARSRAPALPPSGYETDCGDRLQ
jgi:hypothetical protein